MDYDYNKIFAEVYGFKHEEDLNVFDRSYDPDSYSDYEEYDTDEDEDFPLSDHLPVQVPAPIEEAMPIQPSELEIKFGMLNEVILDNKFQHIEDPLFFTSPEKKQILPLLSKIEGTQDLDEVYQAVSPDTRGHVLENNQTEKFVTQVVKTTHPPAVAEKFSLHLKEFFDTDRHEDGFMHFEKDRIKLIDLTDDPEVKLMLAFDENQIQYQQSFNVYIPTKQQRQEYYDDYHDDARIIEEFELAHKESESYNKMQQFIRNLGYYKFELECLWFRYQIAKLDNNVLAKNLLLMSHPMMVPNKFRHKFNELIILPESFNFFDKDESFRFFELMFVRKKHKVFLPSSRIHLYVLKFFKVYFSSYKLRFVKSLPPIYRRLNIMDIYHPTSNVIENLTQTELGPFVTLSVKEHAVTGIIHSTMMPPTNSRRYMIMSSPFRLKDYKGKWKRESIIRYTRS